MNKGYISQFVDVTSTIRVITIQMEKPFEYDVGQYVMVDIEGCESRPFSIASAPRANNTIDIHVRNSGQNVSSVLCSNITQTQPVMISNPMGSLRLQNTNTHKVFIAGGTGVTPFLGMMGEAKAQITLYWGMNSDHEFYTRPQKKGLAVHYCTENYPIDEYLKSSPLDGAEHYISGPPPMVQDTFSKLLDSGVEHSMIFLDE